MKKFLLSLLILSLLIPNNGKSQVAKIENELVSNNEIILIGPLNVDTYFPEQSNLYISKYEKIVDELESLMDAFKSELAYFENKRIKNKTKIGQINSAIEKITLELGILYDFILSWEERALNFNSYNNILGENFNDKNCYSFIIGGDTLKNKEIEIVEVQPEKQIEYYEFIEGDYLEILRIYGKRNYDKKIDNSKYIIRIDGKPREFVISPSGYTIFGSNVLEQIEQKKDFYGIIDGKIQRKMLEIDNPLVKMQIENLFPAFRFDKDEKEFYKERKVQDAGAFFQIWLKEEDRQIIPEKVFLTACE